MNSISNRLKKMRNRKGFTLVELIVVIVIIGILAAIMIPKLTGFTDKAKGTQATVMAKEVATAIDSFHAENSKWPASSDESEIATLSGVSTSAITLGGSGSFYVEYEEGKTFYAGRTDGDSKVEYYDTSKPTLK